MFLLLLTFCSHSLSKHSTHTHDSTTHYSHTCNSDDPFVIDKTAYLDGLNRGVKAYEDSFDDNWRHSPRLRYYDYGG